MGSPPSGHVIELVNGKQHSVWFVPTGMKGLPLNVLLNFRLEFPKSDPTIYLPSRISEIFRQMVSTPYITCKTREQLKLPTVGKETLLIKTFGDNSASVKE